MNSKEVSLSVDLLIATGSNYLGPIKMTIWEHHDPNQLTAITMDEPLQIPMDMRNGKRRYLYSLRNRSYLDDEKTYKDQKIFSGDVLFLTDIEDNNLFVAIAQVIADLKGIAVSTPDKYEETKSKAIARGVLLGIPWIGPALDALIIGPKK